MLVWLDGGNSKKEKPNENFGREFLELFTLGLGHYTEQDIRDAARAFTGWVENHDSNFPPRHQFHFDKARLDDGEKTFLKQTGRWGAADIVPHHAGAAGVRRIPVRQALPLLRQRRCRPVGGADRPAGRGAALARLLDPPPRRGHPALAALLRAAAYRQRIKWPVEFSAGLVRMLEVPRGDVNPLALAAACDGRGRTCSTRPTSRAGTAAGPGSTSTTLLERGNWVSDVVWGNASMGVRAFDPLAWAHAQRPTRPTRLPQPSWTCCSRATSAPQARVLSSSAGRAGHRRRPAQGAPAGPALPRVSTRRPEEETTMQPTRRDFLRAGVGSSTLLACGPTVPTFLARSAQCPGRGVRPAAAASSSSSSSTAATTV